MVLTNAEDTFKVASNMLLISGLWPLENETWRYKLRTTTSWVAILALCLTMWMEFFNDLHDITKLASITYILVAFMSAITKQIGFAVNRKTFQKALNHLKNPIFYAYPDELDQYMATTVKFFTRFTEMIKYLILFWMIIIGIFPFIDKKPLPFPFPYDLGNYQPLMYTFQMVCEYIAAWNHIYLDTCCISLVGIASTQLDILAEKIIRIKADAELYEDGGKREEVVIKRLKHCVEHHLAIMELTEYIENIFSLGFSAQYLASGLMICITIFSFFFIPPSFQFLMLIDYLAVVLIQLYIYCWYGNEILTKTLQLGEACYTFNWYDFGLPVRKYIFIIMERSKRPSCITAFKFISVSLESLTNILQWSYSLLTVLLNLLKKE